MTDSNTEEPDPTTEDEREIGPQVGAEGAELGSVMGHAYRGEIDRVGTWRRRLDQTTTWAVTVLAAILTWAFSSGDNPHYILLIGVVVLTIFLGMEARRYRDYDVFRSRVRLLQQNLFANVLDPTQGVESHDWRVELSRDYRTPTLKVSYFEALANRLRRVYLALLGVLVVAWLFRITAFDPRQDWLTSAQIAYVPGSAVVVVVCGFFLSLLAVTFWPRERHAKGEFREGDPNEWKKTDR